MNLAVSSPAKPEFQGAQVVQSTKYLQNRFMRSYFPAQFILACNEILVQAPCGPFTRWKSIKILINLTFYYSCCLYWLSCIFSILVQPFFFSLKEGDTFNQYMSKEQMLAPASLDLIYISCVLVYLLLDPYLCIINYYRKKVFFSST